MCGESKEQPKPNTQKESKTNQQKNKITVAAKRKHKTNVKKWKWNEYKYSTWTMAWCGIFGWYLLANRILCMESFPIEMRHIFSPVLCCISNRVSLNFSILNAFETLCDLSFEYFASIHFEEENRQQQQQPKERNEIKRMPFWPYYICLRMYQVILWSKQKLLIDPYQAYIFESNHLITMQCKCYIYIPLMYYMLIA